MATTLGGQGKGQAGDGQHQEKRKKESILDLTKYLEKPVRVKFAGKFSAYPSTTFKEVKFTLPGACTIKLITAGIP